MLDGGREAGSIFAVPVYKDDTCILWSRPEREGDGLPRVEPNSCTTHCIRYGLLSPHKVTPIIIYTGGISNSCASRCFCEK